MLSKFILRGAVTAIALACTAGSVSADNFRIIITDFAVFPDVSYVQRGDTVIFENNSGVARIIGSRNSRWVTPEVAAGGEIAVFIGDDAPNEYFARLVGQNGNGGANNSGNDTGTDDTPLDTATGNDTDPAASTDEDEINSGAILGRMNFSLQNQDSTN